MITVHTQRNRELPSKRAYVKVPSWICYLVHPSKKNTTELEFIISAYF